MKNIDSKQVLNIMKNTFYAVDIDLNKLERTIRGTSNKEIESPADLDFIIEKNSLMDNYLNFMTRLHAYMQALEMGDFDSLTEVRMNSFKSILLYYIQYFRDEQKKEEENMSHVLDAGPDATLKLLEEASGIVLEKIAFVNKKLAESGHIEEKTIYNAISDILRTKMQINLIKEKLHMNNSPYNFLHSYFEEEI